jgi:hypothetical protein
MKQYAEWLFRACLLIGVGANLWLTRNFVTRAEYQADFQQNTNDHLSIKSSMVDMGTTLKILALNQSRLDDHEARMRLVETRQVDVLSRLSSLERSERNIKP